MDTTGNILTKIDTALDKLDNLKKDVSHLKKKIDEHVDILKEKIESLDKDFEMRINNLKNTYNLDNNYSNDKVAAWINTLKEK